MLAACAGSDEGSQSTGVPDVPAPPVSDQFGTPPASGMDVPMASVGDDSMGTASAGDGMSPGAGSDDGSMSTDDTDGMSGTAGASGTTGGAGMSGGTAGMGSPGTPSGDPILDRLTVSEVTVAAGVKPGIRNLRIWGNSTFRVAPVFTVPLADCGMLVCFTSGTNDAPNARAVRLGADNQIAAEYDLGAGLECRGISAEPDGHFAALLWDGPGDRIWVKRYDLAGAEQYATELTNADNRPNEFGIGEARLEYGGGSYGAYYHVHSDSGHEGDTLKYVDAQTGAETTRWKWGCSHSMSNLLTYSEHASEFLATCVTDCYPGTEGSNFATTAIGGIYTENRHKVLDVAAGCNGQVAGELGGAAVASTGWKIVFTGHRGPVALGTASYDEATMNQDVVFASIGADHKLSGEVVWLTDTPGVDEADAALARWKPEGDDTEQYILGYMASDKYLLSRLGADGSVLEGPIDVTGKARWGQRDDPFRAHINGDIIWSWFESAGSTTLKLARLRSDGTAQCAAF